MPQLAPERVFEVERIFLQLKGVDVLEQKFVCSCYIEMRVRGGQTDPDFFKKDEDGKTLINTMTTGGKEWPVVPSVMWYLENQVHFPNSFSHELKECKAIGARGSKEDISCILRVDGEFQEEMELFFFPVRDSQSREVDA